ncbi:hypothetical protein HAX54_046871 [Datura stramonium]|uniref:Uncharacterized protein n=1 Tax=Datura stramonium TaxID=4076 RepID=A0ABS8Y802_DATST|nr:hypothetical protein [Datura stramonium]
MIGSSDLCILWTTLRAISGHFRVFIPSPRSHRSFHGIYHRKQNYRGEDLGFVWWMADGRGPRMAGEDEDRGRWCLTVYGCAGLLDIRCGAGGAQRRSGVVLVAAGGEEKERGGCVGDEGSCVTLPSSPVTIKGEGEAERGGCRRRQRRGEKEKMRKRGGGFYFIKRKEGDSEEEQRQWLKSGD